MPRRLFIFAIAACALCSCDQERMTISAARCEISIKLDATIGENAGPNGPKAFSPVVRSKGLYYVGDTYTPGAVSIFDSNGVYVRAFGRAGGGPGDNSSTEDIEIIDDTLFVNDGINKRVSKYLVDGRYLGSFALPSPTTVSPIAGGGLALISNPRDRPPAAIQVRSATDSVKSEFTIRNAVSRSARRANEAGPMIRDVAGRSMWLGYIGQYLLERYTYEGKRLATISKELSWFPPARIFRQNMQKYDTATSMHDFVVTPSGAPLVMLGRQTRVRALLAKEKSEAKSHQEPRPHTEGMESVFHLLNNKTGDVVAERIFKSDTVFAGFADASHPWALRETADGTPVLDIYHITITKPNSTEVCR